MTAQPPEIEPTLYGAPQVEPMSRMWRAALACLLSDAVCYWEGRPPNRDAEPTDFPEAFEDLVECGPIAHRLSSMCGLDPQYVSASFIRWCEQQIEILQ